MRTEQFENAINDIHSRAKELVMNQLPTLDGIMQVDKMSPEDRVFYEAYKKYGNRNTHCVPITHNTRLATD